MMEDSQYIWSWYFVVLLMFLQYWMILKQSWIAISNLFSFKYQEDKKKVKNVPFWKGAETGFKYNKNSRCKVVNACWIWFSTQHSTCCNWNKLTVHCVKKKKHSFQFLCISNQQNIANSNIGEEDDVGHCFKKSIHSPIYRHIQRWFVHPKRHSKFYSFNFLLKKNSLTSFA